MIFKPEIWNSFWDGATEIICEITDQIIYYEISPPFFLHHREPDQENQDSENPYEIPGPIRDEVSRNRRPSKLCPRFDPICERDELLLGDQNSPESQQGYRRRKHELIITGADENQRVTSSTEVGSVHIIDDEEDLLEFCKKIDAVRIKDLNPTVIYTTSAVGQKENRKTSKVQKMVSRSSTWNGSLDLFKRRTLKFNKFDLNDPGMQTEGKLLEIEENDDSEKMLTTVF